MLFNKAGLSVFRKLRAAQALSIEEYAAESVSSQYSNIIRQSIVKEGGAPE